MEITKDMKFLLQNGLTKRDFLNLIWNYEREAVENAVFNNLLDLEISGWRQCSEYCLTLAIKKFYDDFDDDETDHYLSVEYKITDEKELLNKNEAFWSLFSLWFDDIIFNNYNSRKNNLSNFLDIVDFDYDL